MICRICHFVGTAEMFVFEERLLGTGRRFSYFQCMKCGCLQIANVPDDLHQFYRGGYFDKIKGNWGKETCTLGKLRRFVAKLLFSKGFLGNFLQIILGNTVLASVARLRISFDSSILDVGCGTGDLLRTLGHIGFKRLTGIDPLAPPQSDVFSEIRFYQADPMHFSSNDGFDLIMLHHVLEHVENNFELICHVKEWLNPDGIILLRLPLVDSWSWRHFGKNWIQLDPPRHLFIHSEKSVQFLAKAVDMKIITHYRDSTPAQITRSRNIRKKKSVDSRYGNFSSALLSVLRSFLLNFLGSGDQGVFILKMGD